MANKTLQKVLAGAEDLLFGQGTVKQQRGTSEVEVSKINADNIPFSGDKATGNFISIAERLVGTAEQTGTVGALIMPTGNDTQRPVAPVTGYTRFNTDQGGLETWNGTAWETAGTQVNAASATKLQTARLINGTPFDGTSDINLDTYTQAEADAKFAAQARLFDETGSNFVTGTIRWSSANRRFEKFDGTNWNALDTKYSINVLHADTAGSASDADQLGGQVPSYYLSAATYTAADVLAKLLTVDGPGSGLDADKVDGLSLGNTGTNYIPYADATGLVKLGNLESSVNLTVKGSNSEKVTFQRTAETQGNYLRFLNSDSTSAAFIGYTSPNNDFTIANSKAGYLRFSTNSTERARITSGGNVLIGTTTDGSAKLFVHTDTDVYAARIGSVSNANLRIAGTAGGAVGGYAMLQTFTDNTTKGGRLVLQRDSGNVLIGTTTDTYGKLQVEGDIFFNNAALVAAYTDSSNIDHIWHDDATNSWHLCSDAARKSTGNSNLTIGSVLNLSDNAGVTEGAEILMRYGSDYQTAGADQRIDLFEDTLRFHRGGTVTFDHNTINGRTRINNGNLLTDWTTRVDHRFSDISEGVGYWYHVATWEHTSSYSHMLAHFRHSGRYGVDKFYVRTQVGSTPTASPTAYIIPGNQWHAGLQNNHIRVTLDASSGTKTVCKLYVYMSAWQVAGYIQATDYHRHSGVSEITYIDEATAEAGRTATEPTGVHGTVSNSSANFVWNANNMLIGTTTDTGEKLQVVGTVKAQSLVSENTNNTEHYAMHLGNTYVGTGNQSVTQVFRGMDTSATFRNTAYITSMALDQDWYSTVLRFRVRKSGTTLEPMRLTGDSVLIGTTTDNGTDKLQVNGAVLSTGVLKSDGDHGAIQRGMNLYNNGSLRWLIGHYTTGDETGGNAGSNFQIHARDDAGNGIGTHITVIRSNGNVLVGTTTDNSTDKLQVNGTISSLSRPITPVVMGKVVNGVLTHNGAGTYSYSSTTNQLTLPAGAVADGARVHVTVTQTGSTAASVSWEWTVNYTRLKFNGIVSDNFTFAIYDF